jgi:copper chaperone CopZ
METEKIKTYVMIVLIVVAVGAGLFWVKSSFLSSQSGSIVSGNGQELRVATVELPGLFCASCAWSSENTIKGIPGVVDANVDIKVKKGTVLYDPNIVSSEQLVEPELIQSYEGKIVNDEPYERK